MQPLDTAQRYSARISTCHTVVNTTPGCSSYAQVVSDTNVLAVAGEGPLAFCSGGDQSVRGKGGYVGEDSVPRLNVLDLQMQIRRLPKPVVAMVAGYAVGGGHILHMVCDLTVSL